MARLARRALMPVALLGALSLVSACSQSLNEKDRASMTSLESAVNASREEARAARVTAERAQASADQAARAAQAAADRAEQASRRAEEANERANRMFQYNLRK